MRKKERKLVITFHTTTDAMRMEKICKEKQMPGRLIPVPREISAGCGLSWCVDPEYRELLTQTIHEAGLAEQDMHEVMV